MILPAKMCAMRKALSFAHDAVLSNDLWEVSFDFSYSKQKIATYVKVKKFLLRCGQNTGSHR